MRKLGLTELALLATLTAPTTASGLLGSDGRFLNVRARGSCSYVGLVLEVDCAAGRNCTIEKVSDAQGNPEEYPKDLCPPDVAFKMGKILYCIPQPKDKCYTAPKNKCDKNPLMSGCPCC